MHGATKPPMLRSNPLLSSGRMVDPVSANTLLQVQNQHLTYKLYSTHIMHTESGERALWGRIKGCCPQFSVSPRARASCSLGAGQHFPFGTIVVNTAEKPRLSPTARLPSRKPRVRRKPALRNAQQVQRENSSVPGIPAQASGNASETDSPGCHPQTPAQSAPTNFLRVTRDFYLP